MKKEKDELCRGMSELDFMPPTEAVCNKSKIKQALPQNEKDRALEEYETLKKFSTQETVYTIYGTHTNETVLIDFSLRRIHISTNGNINDCYTLCIDDHKKTWWLKEDRSE